MEICYHEEAFCGAWEPNGVPKVEVGEFFATRAGEPPTNDCWILNTGNRNWGEEPVIVMNRGRYVLYEGTTNGRAPSKVAGSYRTLDEAKACAIVLWKLEGA